MTPRSSKRVLSTLALAGALGLTATACATETTTTESGVQVVSEGELTVCTSLPYKPFEYRQGDEVVGFDMDLMQRVAEANDLDLSVEVTGFEGIQSGQALNSGTCDVAAAGMTITPEREEAVDFSEPYFDATQALLTTDESIDSLEALDGMTLGVMSGTTGELYAEDNAPEGVEIKSFEDLGLQTRAVQGGQVDAIIQDNGPLLDLAKENDDLFVTAEFDTGESYGFAVRKDQNDPLLESIDTVVSDARDDGSYDEIYEKWFGQAPTDAR
ncbi:MULTISPECIES: transporter substrate-binding domain-containing protein [Nocardioides]|jgi:polar amino acid transport system substrate-binding protein|uniref:transporter substrate-binding domain-containing protein n=1 Tax=Nocardioides TaxID=1839 RepID=UPI0018791117|nr:MULTISPECIES: transporter substrate-binding domain-containing protein [Nocardioides]MCM3516205.1 transporter substrate-binding domain-containing protein [Nocardioides sp. P86]